MSATAPSVTQAATLPLPLSCVLFRPSLPLLLPPRRLQLWQQRATALALPPHPASIVSKHVEPAIGEQSRVSVTLHNPLAVELPVLRLLAHLQPVDVVVSGSIRSGGLPIRSRDFGHFAQTLKHATILSR